MVRRAFPFPVQEVQIDHGTEFTCVFFPHVYKPHPFEKALGDLAIRHKLIPVGSPSRTARSNAVTAPLDEECLNYRTFRKTRPRELAIKRWVNFYNSQRPHSSLQWSTPLHKLRSFQTYRSVTHVWNHYSRAQSDGAVRTPASISFRTVSTQGYSEQVRGLWHSNMAYAGRPRLLWSEDSMDQATFADLEYDGKKRKTRREIFLERMDGLIPWEQLEERIRLFYPKAGRGRRPYDLAVMLRIHCVQLFYNLSDPGMEDML